MAKETFTYNFSVSAENREEAVKIMTALTKFAKAGEPSDLEKLAAKVEKNPGLIKTALKYI